MTWGSSERLTWNSGESYNPTIAVNSSNNIHGAWEDNTPGNFEIFFKRSQNGSATWSGDTRLTWNPGFSYNPAIAVDSSDNIHVVWYDYTPGNFEILYKRSTDGGVKWGALKRLTWNSGDSKTPAIAIDSNTNIHVVWHDDTPVVAEVYYKRSPNGGLSWGSSKRLTWNPGFSTSTAIAVDSNNTIHVVWNNNTSGNPEIYYKKGKQ